MKSVTRKSTIKPPSEVIGSTREQELIKMYGKNARSIQLAETAIQMEFDKNLDKYSPPLWPSLPLKL